MHLSLFCTMMYLYSTVIALKGIKHVLYCNYSPTQMLLFRLYIKMDSVYSIAMFLCNKAFLFQQNFSWNR